MTERTDLIEELLVEWELARQNGRLLSPAELCREYPEVEAAVREQISILQATSWLLIDEAKRVHDDKTGTSAAHDTRLPDTDVTVAEFVKQVTDIGLLSDSGLSTVSEFVTKEMGDRATKLATRLVEEEALTEYQARVILQRGNSPLLLDRYIILDTLGSGGMGLVFKAFHRSMERTVALKVLPEFAVDSNEKVARFRREIKAAAKLSHPNVVSALDAHESNGTHFLVMEYVEGQNLTEYVTDNGPFPVVDAVSVIAQVAAGLSEAHRQGIIHRDIKPTNIMLTGDGVAKVVDLGLSRTKGTANTSSSELTRDGLAMGTVAFMSPEQALDAKEADARSDIYSLGCTMHYLLTGHAPFEKKTSVQTILAHREETTPSLSASRSDIPSWLERVYSRMMAKSPTERYSSAEELHRELTNSGATTTTLSRPSANPQTATTKRIPFLSWERMVLAGIALIALFAALLALSSWTSRNSDAFSSRDIAKTVLNTGGQVIAETGLGELTLSDIAEFPDGEFTIAGIELIGGMADNPGAILAAVPELRSLSLVGFDTSDFSDMRLESLSSLRLSDCSIGDAGMEFIGQMGSLDTLELTDNDSFPSNAFASLTRLTKLSSLTIVGSDVSRALKSLSELQQLQSLDLSESKFKESDLEFLSPKLIELRLADCELNDTAGLHVRSLTQLQLLDLTGTNVGDKTLRGISELKQLSTLLVGKTNVTSVGIEHLREITALRDLDLSYATLTPEMAKSLGNLTQLTTLDLTGTNLDDTTLMELNSLPNLETLFVEDTKVSTNGLEGFGRSNPNCEVVDDAIVVFFE